MYRILITLLLSFPAYTFAEECTILIHGLARTESSMAQLGEALSKAGYKVVNQGYKSTKSTIQVLADSNLPNAIKKCGNVKKINFVTHSMGGILVRYYLAKNKIANLGSVIMLGPPNKGSQVVDEMGNFPGFKFINGPAGMQLGTGKSSIPNSLGPVDFDTGIIAGTRSINLILSTQLPNPDDGKVSVENTKLEGMRDHVTMPVTHTFMMRNEKVIKQVLYYLKHGKFNKAKTS